MLHGVGVGRGAAVGVQQLAVFVEFPDQRVDPGDDGFGVADANIPVHDDIAGGQAGQIPVAGGGQLGNVGPVGGLAGATDQGGGQHKGQVTDGGHKAVVFVGADVVGLGVDRLGQSSDFAHGALVGFGAGDDAVGLAGEQGGVGVFRAGRFLAGHGMAADEIHGVGQQFIRPFQNLAFGAAHVGDDAALGPVGRQALHQFAHRHYGGGEDDDVGVVNGVAQPVFHAVESLPPLRPGAGVVVGVGADDGKVLEGGLAQGQAQGGANQSGADDGNLCHEYARPFSWSSRSVQHLPGGGKMRGRRPLYRFDRRCGAGLS